MVVCELEFVQHRRTGAIRYRSFPLLLLSAQGLILAFGAGSAVVVEHLALASPAISQDTIKSLCGWVSCGLVLAVTGYLCAARKLRIWPFQPVLLDFQVTLREQFYRLGASALAGCGIGAYAGLLHHLDWWGTFHVFTVIGYFVMIPLSFACVVLGTPRFTTSIPPLLVMVVALEISAQAGVYYVRGRRLWWDDITRINLAFLAGGVTFSLLVASFRRWRSGKRSAHQLSAEGG